LPQQLPGPAHPACIGEDPQQAVSPGPGIFWAEDPDKEEGAESIFLRLGLPQLEHCGLSVAVVTRISLSFLQSRQR